MSERDLDNIIEADGGAAVLDGFEVAGPTVSEVRQEKQVEKKRQAVILAGGLGTRLKPFTDVIPKPLLPVGEKAVLEIQIERLARAGFNEVILATNYKGGYIGRFLGDGENYGINLVISQEKEALGTVGPLSLLRDRLQDPFLVMNGDILTLMDFEDMYAYACGQEALFTAGIKEGVTPFSFGNIHFDGNLITGVEEKPDLVSYVLAGVYMMKPEVLDLVPDSTYFGIDDLICTMLDQGMPVAKYDIEEYWLDIGRPVDYEKAQRDARMFDE